MPAADELFRTTAGNGTLMHNGRGEEADQRPARERGPGGPNAPGHTTAAPPSAVGSKGPVKTVPAPAGPAAPAGASATEAAVKAPPAAQTGPASAAAAPEPAPEPPPAPPARKVTAPRRPTGRERHDEKITVYVSPDELLGLEHARITLRGEYGVAVDRGRIVREAVAALLADLDARGRDSILVKRLSDS
ncbi:hypothetical protein GCM10009838_80740 [Catenulispora subtropica]|uniref:Cobyrinic acid ac-diamide synthase n=2 Tax=Catenulispora subtropica TaxID=450798 RepID=A0ABN2T9N5_9ACTN